MPATGDDPFDVVVQLRRQRLELQQLGEAEDRVEGGAQLVAEPGDELVLRPGLPFGRLPGPDVLGVLGGDHEAAVGIGPYRH